nr:hypothetical protein [Tanacetum cinerariifolium]
CPYLITGWSWPTSPSNGPSVGILGPHPNQAYATSIAPSTLAYAPELESVMHTMTLNPPDENWYMDIGASSHMTGSQGTLSYYSHMSIPKHIIVGNGHAIQIQGLGNKILSPSYPPLKLSNVLHVPHLIKNLISVRRLSIGNNISITFDPFGFTLKDFLTGIQLMRYDSNGDLYPLTTTALQQLQPPFTFAVFSQDLWHRRLGHLNVNVLSFLKNKNYITCWSRPTGPSTGPSAGILRPRPSQAYAASVAPSTLAYAPELESAIHNDTQSS